MKSDLLKRLTQIVCLFIFLGGILFCAKESEASTTFKVEAVFIPDLPSVQTVSLPIPSIEPFEIKEKTILFTGDSRFVGMSQVENSGELFLAESGKGFSYFCFLQDEIKKEDTDIVVVGFGVNDLYNADKYIDYLNGNPFNKEVYFLTVNPVDEVAEAKYGYNVKNEDIATFNQKIKEEAVCFQVIDTNSYLWEIGFETKDGLHYRDETYQNIYNYIIKELR